MNKIVKRNLSGIYFREKVDGHWDNVCFEDCAEETQNRILETKSPKFIQGLAKMLGQTLKEIGDKFDILKE